MDATEAPVVSFVLPAYKGKFLRRAIGSILEQTFADFELVVVDDGSPEDLASIVAGFSDSRVTFRRYDNNLGGQDLVGAWNRAMKLARGEFTVLASDDDVYHPRYLKEMLSLAKKYPHTNLFHCRIAIIDENEKVFEVGERGPEYETCARMLYARGATRRIQRAAEFMFRTAAFRSGGGFVWMPRAWYSDDATWLSLSRSGGVACSPELLFMARDSSLNICSCRTDVVEKLKAGELFRKWVHAFIETCEPVDEDDMACLKEAKRGIDREIDRMGRWVLRRAPPRLAVRAIRALDISWGQKARLLLRMAFLGRRRHRRANVENGGRVS